MNDKLVNLQVGDKVLLRQANVRFREFYPDRVEVISKVCKNYFVIDKIHYSKRTGRMLGAMDGTRDYLIHSIHMDLK